MSEYLYTIREMAKFMETSPAGLKALRRDGKGPRHIVQDGRVLYPASALAEWRRECERASSRARRGSATITATPTRRCEASVME